MGHNQYAWCLLLQQLRLCELRKGSSPPWDLAEAEAQPEREAPPAILQLYGLHREAVPGLGSPLLPHAALCVKISPEVAALRQPPLGLRHALRGVGNPEVIQEQGA